jgi:hypothetical protein
MVPLTSAEPPTIAQVVHVDLDVATSMIPVIPMPASTDGPTVQITNGDVYRTTRSGDSLCITSSSAGISACGNPAETGGLLSLSTPDDNNQVTIFLLTATATQLSFVPEDCAVTWTSSTDDLVLRACQAKTGTVGVNFNVPNDAATYRFNVSGLPADWPDQTD